MLNSVLLYIETNYPLLIIAAAAYAFWREFGAVAAGALGQISLNVDLSLSAYIENPFNQSCGIIIGFARFLPLTLYIVLPSVFSILLISSRLKENGFAQFLIFWSAFFTAVWVNLAVLASRGVPLAADTMGGAALLAGLLGVAAVTVAKLSGQLASCGEVQTGLVVKAPKVRRMCDQPGVSLIEQTTHAYPGSPLHREPVFAFKVIETSHKEGNCQASAPTYLFNRNEFFIFRHEHLKELEDLIYREPPRVIEGLQSTICRRLGRTPIPGEERAFVRAYVAEFRKQINKSCPEFFLPERLDLAA